MADKNDKLKKGLLKDILKQVKGVNEQFEKVAQAEMEAAAEGKGFISGTFAKAKARERIAQEYMMATKGTINKRQAIFDALGLEKIGKMAEAFSPGEKAEPPAELVKKFGLDKKSAKQGGAAGRNIAKPLSLILRNVIETNKIVKTIEKSLAKASAPRSSRYVFDPRMAGGGRYRDTVTNKLVSTKVAQGERTAALTAAIGADEQPLVQLKETLDSRFEELDESIKNIRKLESAVSGIKFSIDGVIPRMVGLSVHSKLDLILAKSSAPDVDLPDSNRRKPSVRDRLKKGVKGLGRLATRAIGVATSAPVVAAAGAAAVVGAGAYALNRGMTAAGNTAKSAMDALEKKYGLKPIYDAKGNATGYSVNGRNYGLTDLPQEYKDLIAAYGPGDKRSFDARQALARINKNPEKYRMLEIGYKPKPAAAISTPPVQSKVTGAPTTAAPTSTAQRAISAVRGTVSAAVTAGSTAASKVGSTVGGAVTSAGAAVSGAASGIMGTITSAMNSVGLTNKFAQIALLANIKKESGFKPTGENLKYSGTSNDRIRKIFGSRAAKYSDEELNVIKKDEYKMGELMYGKDTRVGQSMGNKEEGDGYKYRGRGFIQLTGKNNYAAYGKQIGVDLVGNPDLANDPVIAAQIAARFIMTGLKNKINFTDQKSANMAVTKTIGGNLDLSKGYGAEILAKVDAYSNDFGNISGGSTSGSTGSGPMLASTTAPSSSPMVASTTPSSSSITPAQNTTGTQVAQGSSQLETSKMVASTAQPAAPVVINNSVGNNNMPPQAPKQPLPMASTRPSDNAYNRAIAKDFAHPTAFTSVGMA
jgi:predicted chitinase